MFTDTTKRWVSGRVLTRSASCWETSSPR